jgi:hypothetical protein
VWSGNNESKVLVWPGIDHNCSGCSLNDHLDVHWLRVADRWLGTLEFLHRLFQLPFFFIILIFIYYSIALKVMKRWLTPTLELPLGFVQQLIMCIPLAYGLSLIKSEWFFQGMLMIIGGRYLTFASMFGMRIFWILGAVLGMSAYILFKFQAGDFTSALTGGLIEVIFGIAMFISYRNNIQKNRVKLNEKIVSS